MFFVALDESEELVDGFLLRDILENTFLPSVEADAVAAGTYVAVVGIGHLAGTVDDATHNGNLESLTVSR